MDVLCMIISSVSTPSITTYKSVNAYIVFLIINYVWILWLLGKTSGWYFNIFEKFGFYLIVHPKFVRVEFTHSGVKIDSIGVDFHAIRVEFHSRMYGFHSKINGYFTLTDLVCNVWKK